MKKSTLLLLVILFTAFTLHAQSSLSIFGGYGKSNFDLGSGDETSESVEISQAAFIPAGVQLLFGGPIQLGAELSYSVVPFTFESKGANGVKIADEKISQILAGGVLRINFGDGNIRPYVRGGAGLYMGNDKVEYSDEFKQEMQDLGYAVEDTTINFKSAFGFNAGGGLSFKLGSNSALFGEFIYHIVKREADIQGAEKTKMDNWAARVGLQIGL